MTRPRKSNIRWENLAVVAIASTIWGVFLAWALRYREERYQNPRLGYMFDSDGPYQSERLISMWEAGVPFSEGFYFYGNTHHFFAFYLGNLVELLSPKLSTFELASISLQVTQLSFALVGSVALYLTVVGITKWPALSMLLVVAMFTSTAVFFWTYEIHPDAVQLGLIAMFIFCATRRNSIRAALFAGVFLGLAIGAKYQAALYTLFFLVLQIGVLRKGVGASQNVVWQRSLLAILLFAGGAFIGFGVPNFSIFREPSNFFASVRQMSDQAAYGWGIESSDNPLLWIPVIWSQSNILIILSVLVLGALVFQGHFMAAWRRLAFDPIFQATVITFLLGLGYLAISVHLRLDRYFIFLMPLLVVIVASLSAAAINSWRVRAGKSFAFFSVIALMSPILLLPNFQTLVNAVQESASDSRIEAGDFVKTHCSRDTPVFVAPYSYVPPEFKNVTTSWEISEENIDRADVLVFNDSIPGRYIWPIDGKIIISNLDISATQAEVLVGIFRGESQFSLQLDLDRTKIYFRSNSTFCDKE